MQYCVDLCGPEETGPSWQPFLKLAPTLSMELGLAFL